MSEREPAAQERADVASETVRRYFGREVLHLVTGVYENEDDAPEAKT